MWYLIDAHTGDIIAEFESRLDALAAAGGDDSFTVLPSFDDRQFLVKESRHVIHGCRFIPA